VFFVACSFVSCVKAFRLHLYFSDGGSASFLRALFPPIIVPLIDFYTLLSLPRSFQQIQPPMLIKIDALFLLNRSKSLDQVFAETPLDELIISDWMV
jgi:hypothetical protein